MPATVKPSTTMEATSTSNRPAAETTAAMEVVETTIAVERRAAMEFSRPSKTGTPNPTTPVETRAASPVRVTVEAVEPRSGADKDTASKVVRPIVSVRCTSVRIIAVVSIGTVRRRTDIGWPRRNRHANRSHADRHLSMSRSNSRR